MKEGRGFEVEGGGKEHGRPETAEEGGREIAGVMSR